jgi:hypothetical protein
MRILLAVSLIMTVPAAATAADDKSAYSGTSPVATAAPSDPAQSGSQPDQQFGHILPQIPATSGTPTLGSSGHILPSPKLQQRAAVNRYRAAVPLAAVPIMHTPARIVRSSGLRVVHPPRISSRAAADNERDLAEPLSFKDLPTKSHERLW